MPTPGPARRGPAGARPSGRPAASPLRPTGLPAPRQTRTSDIICGMRLCTRLTSISAALMVLASAQSARADATMFLGTTPTPSSRPVTGWSVGVSMLVIGFEFEYASTQEDADRLAPSLRTGMGNVLVQ